MAGRHRPGDRAGDPPDAGADQERRQRADIVHIHQMLLGRGRGRNGQEFVEPVNDRPWKP